MVSNTQTAAKIAMAKLRFSVDSALLSELGEKLVESVHIALLELVKKRVRRGRHGSGSRSRDRWGLLHDPHHRQRQWHDAGGCQKLLDADCHDE
jgi:hypothetical protein